jgi:hypothetical protein
LQLAVRPCSRVYAPGVGIRRVETAVCFTPTCYPSFVNGEVWANGRNRLALVFRIITLLFSTEPASTCVLLDGYILAPLPAPKSLWEAKDMGESLGTGKGQSVFGIKAGGKMLRLDGGGGTEEGSEYQSMENWQEWIGGMDGLGALVMLAASLDV